MQATANSRISIQSSRSYGLYLGVSAVIFCAVIIGSCSSDPPSGPTPQPRDPTVVASINPADSATGASLNSIVTATFSRDLNLSSINTGTFLVSGVSGSISVSGKTATFTPNARLLENTTYTVIMTTGIMDSDGEPLASYFTSRFTTGVPQAVNAGPDQDVTIGGAVMFSATSDLTGTVTFSWTQVSGPSVVALSGASPSFTAPDTVSTLEFDVIADNGNGPSDPDRVVVWVLEDKDNAIWVSTSGSDSNPGSRDLPLATIQFAIDTAYNAGNDADVYIAAGVYNQSILVRSRVSLYGGYHATSWLRDINFHETFIVGSDLALKGFRPTALTIDGLRIKSASAMANGQYGLSSIAIGFEQGDSITISHCIVTAQDGESGKHGILPNSPNPSEDGHKGENAGACDRAGGAGGQILTGVGSGGAGGAGGLFDGGPGFRGEGTHGGARGIGGHGPGATGENGTAGLGGNDGAPSTIGGGSIGNLRRFDFGGYTRSNGGNEGSNGTNGSGGGGGGGGGGFILCGAGGGGGGAGGLGGRRGFRGDAGGGSFGILLYRVTNCRIINCHIITGNGGAGGSGGSGAVRGKGGKGGKGGIYNSGGAGGNGGNGGDGGNGGNGSGGGGGPSIGIIESGEVSFKSGLTFQLGTPGAGGSGPGGAADGATGLKAEVKSLL